MPFLQWGGWKDDACSNVHISVGFIKSVLSNIFLSLKYIVVSRKLTLVLEYSPSNLIVSWIELACFMNFIRLSSPCCHIIIMSSMNRFHRTGRSALGACVIIVFSI